MRKYYWILGLGLAVLVACPTRSHAWDLRDIVEHLYSEDGVSGIHLGGGTHTPEFSGFSEFENLNAGVGSELTSLSLNLGSPNIGMTSDVDTGLPVRTTETFGPIFSERAQTIGRRNLKIGASYTRLDFEEFEGDDISEIQVFALTEGAPFPFNNDQLIINADFQIKEDVVALSAIYGVTDRFDIGVFVPFIDIDYKINAHADVWGYNQNTGLMELNPSGEDPDGGGPLLIPNPAHQFDSSILGDDPDSAVKGDATGIGDVIVRAKYFLWEAKYSDVAAILDFKLPTGDEKRLLGTGDLNVTPSIVFSKTFYDGLFNPHVNIGYEFNGTDSELSQLVWSTGFDSKITDWLTGAVDIVGFNELDGDDVGDNIFDISLGLKVNPWGDLVLFASVQIPLNDEGLRTEFTPTVGAEYTF